jgi:1-acyl-sn-glycerol-3-phosphate acyltransferase
MTFEISPNQSPTDDTPADGRSSHHPTNTQHSITIDLSVREAVRELLREPRFLRLLSVFTKNEAPALKEAALLANTESEFQLNLCCGLLTAILERTAKQVTLTGVEQVGESPGCLYISNHRDIFLDSAILNRMLLERGMETPHVVIGDNLLKSTWLRPFYRLCRAIVVQRELKGKELFEHSLRLSEFVRDAIARGEPVWIAQRSGRTKDGFDRTEPALLRMLLLSYERTPEVKNHPFYVVPVAISYELEPCDVFKAATSLGARTKNASSDRARHDAANILRGLVQPKGRIALSIRPRIILDNSEARASNRADKIATLANQVDREIISGYQLWPTNYIACDLIHGSREYEDYYSSNESFEFINYIERRAREIEAPIESARQALFELYARPVLAEQAAQAHSKPLNSDPIVEMTSR